jgi:hypothetical protein
MILVQNWPGLAMYRSLLFMKQPAKPGRPAIGNGPKPLKMRRRPQPPTAITIMSMGNRMITVMTTGIAMLMIIVIRTNTAMITGIRSTIITMGMITGIIIMSTEKSMVTIK